MGRACSKHRKDENLKQKFLTESLKVRDHSEFVSVDGKILLE
jgi:hypothetical protein